MKIAVQEKKTYITPKGLEKLKRELDHLRVTRRQEIANILADTEGDVEDTEYLMAIDEQAFVEGRILELLRLLTNVQVIEPGMNHGGIVDIGSTVVIKEDGMASETYTIVGSAEADPPMGMISDESPIGKALIGCKVGDEKRIQTPSGLVRYRVLAVR